MHICSMYDEESETGFQCGALDERGEGFVITIILWKLIGAMVVGRLMMRLVPGVDCY